MINDQGNTLEEAINECICLYIVSITVAVIFIVLIQYLKILNTLKKRMHFSNNFSFLF